MDKHLYTEEEVVGILMNLVNGIGYCAKGDIMPKRYKQKVNIDGEEHWVTGRTLKDLLEAYLELCVDQGKVVPAIMLRSEEKPEAPLLEPYLRQYYDLYKRNQQSLTVMNREQNIKTHILPKFGNKKLDEINLKDLQTWFNEMDKKGMSHETIVKIKNIFSPVLDSAVEDGYISKNPLRSTRLVLGGAPVEHHKAIPKEKMSIIREELPRITDVRTRMMLGLLGYPGMRLEEILGLRWEDIDFSDNWIYIERAVVHPKRNLPEVKEPKSKTSKRRIPLAENLKKVLVPKYLKGYILASTSDKSRETPMSYTEARNIINKIRRDFDLHDYSAHDFRDTCATEWREAGIPTDVIARLLGHAKSDITETRDVKYRDDVYQYVRAVMNNQNGTD